MFADLECPFELMLTLHDASSVILCSFRICEFTSLLWSTSNFVSLSEQSLHLSRYSWFDCELLFITDRFCCLWQLLLPSSPWLVLDPVLHALLRMFFSTTSESDCSTDWCSRQQLIWLKSFADKVSVSLLVCLKHWLNILILSKSWWFGEQGCDFDLLKWGPRKGLEVEANPVWGRTFESFHSLFRSIQAETPDELLWSWYFCFLLQGKGEWWDVEAMKGFRSSDLLTLGSSCEPWSQQIEDRGLRALEEHGRSPPNVVEVKAWLSAGDSNRGVLSGVLDWLTAFCLASGPLCPRNPIIHWGDLVMSTWDVWFFDLMSAMATDTGELGIFSDRHSDKDDWEALFTVPSGRKTLDSEVNKYRNN